MMCSKWPRGSGTSVKTDVVFWIINIVLKSGNALLRHFQLNVDNSEAKVPLVLKSDKSRPKSRVPYLIYVITDYKPRKTAANGGPKMAANLNVFKTL